MTYLAREIGLCNAIARDIPTLTVRQLVPPTMCSHSHTRVFGFAVYVSQQNGVGHVMVAPTIFIDNNQVI